METQAVGGNIKLEWVVNRARLYLRQGQLAAAGDWLEAQGIGEVDLLAPGPAPEARQTLAQRLPAYMVMAHVRLAQGRLDHAKKLLDAMQALAEAARFAEVLIEAAALQAIVADRRRDRAQALDFIREAVRLAAPQGWKRPLLNVGRPLVPLLRQVAGECEQAPFALSVLDDLAEISGFGQPPPAARAGTGGPVGLVEVLTERELEVVGLIADGLSNAEIASRLVVTVGTVKAHTSNLYGKLGVNTRTRAVAQARALGLL
jgi:LuxR family maltose regulon positive regulatory protein